MTMTADTKAALKNFQHSKLELFHDIYDRIWSEGWTNLEGKTTVFIQSIQNDSRVKDNSFPQNIERGRSSIKRQVITTMQTVTKFLFTTSPATDGFGLRFLGGLNILDFNVDNLELEFVYSTKAIGQCNIFRKLYETVRGEKAIKLFGEISRGFVGFIDVHPLIRLNGAVGIGAVVSLDTVGKYAIQFLAEVSILGVTAEATVFVLTSIYKAIFGGYV